MVRGCSVNRNTTANTTSTGCGTSNALQSHSSQPNECGQPSQNGKDAQTEIPSQMNDSKPNNRARSANGLTREPTSAVNNLRAGLHVSCARPPTTKAQPRRVRDAGTQPSPVPGLGCLGGPPLSSLDHGYWFLVLGERNRHGMAGKQIPVRKIEHNARLPNGNRGK